jgi:hypothetical protein
MAVTITSYSETNVDAYHEINANHPSAGAAASARGMAFTTPAQAYYLTQVKFYLERYGDPTGNVTAQLFAATGTVGTDAKPTGSALATSANYDLATFPTDPTLLTFTFATPYELAASTDYCIVIVNPASGIDTSNYVNMGIDESSSSYAGNRFYYNSSAWTASSTNDYAFYVIGNSKEGAITVQFI